MSTSIALVTCADVSSERRMCSAMPCAWRSSARTSRPAAPARPRCGLRGAVGPARLRVRRRCGAGAAGCRCGRRRCGRRGRSLRRRAGLDEAEDVLLRHAAAAAGALDLARVDAVLGRDLRDHRRDERLAVRGLPSAAGGAELRLCCGRRAVRATRRRQLLPRPRRSPARARAPPPEPGLRARLLRCAPSPPITASFVPDLDGLAFLHEDLGERRRCPGSAPRCRPCRSRSRAAARRPRPAHPAA